MVVIFPDFDPNARGISLFLAGLSNETIAIDHPTKNDENGFFSFLLEENPATTH